MEFTVHFDYTELEEIIYDCKEEILKRYGKDSEQIAEHLKLMHENLQDGQEIERTPLCTAIGDTVIRYLKNSGYIVSRYDYLYSIANRELLTIVNKLEYVFETTQLIYFD